MSKSFVRDMTKGNITSHLLGFTIPLLAGNLFQQLYNMADSVIVGRFVGATALGAVGAVGSLNFLCFSLCIGLANGIGILVSQRFGSKDDAGVKTCIAQAVYVTLVAGLLMSFLGAFFADPILRFMNVPEANFNYSLTYMRIVCGFSFVIAAYNSISAILRSLGDSKTPLIFLAVASVVNIVLDLLFVVVFKWEVAGAAIATVIAQGISAVGSIVFGMINNPYLRIEKSYFKPDEDTIKREVQIGLPLAAQASTIAVSCVALQGVVNGFGSLVMAAYTASTRIEQLVQQPFNTLGMAMSTFAGQNFGAGEFKRIKKSSVIGMVMVAIFSAMMITLMYTLGDNIIGIFIGDRSVMEIGGNGLRITSLMYLFLGMIYVMRGILNGLGDVTFSMMNGFAEVVCRVGFAFGLIKIFSMDYMAAWYTNGLTWTLVGLMSFIRFYFYIRKRSNNRKG